MKLCVSCQVEKPLSEFKLRKGCGKVVTYLPHSYCLECARAKQRSAQKNCMLRNPGRETERMRSYRSDPEFKVREKANARAVYEANKEVVRKQKREYSRANPHLAREYRKNNPEVILAAKARYRSALLNAMPSWVDQSLLTGVYATASRIKSSTGIDVHVDHIIPLQGVNVCGLHVPWNLQVLTAYDNRSKGNRQTFAIGA